MILKTKNKKYDPKELKTPLIERSYVKRPLKSLALDMLLCFPLIRPTFKLIGYMVSKTFGKFLNNRIENKELLLK